LDEHQEGLEGPEDLEDLEIHMEDCKEEYPLLISSPSNLQET